MEALPADFAALLQTYGITGREVPMVHNGYSGARLSAVTQETRRYVIKRLRFDDNWVMRVSHDDTCREAQLACRFRRGDVAPGVHVPTVGAARDGAGWALLMDDIGPALLAPDREIAPHVLDTVLAGIAAVHAHYWRDARELAGVGWCPVRDRLVYLSPAVGAMLAGEGPDFGVERGWIAFQRHAPSSVTELVEGLFCDVSPLVELLGTLPSSVTHGDLKAANIGVVDDRLWLIDWGLATWAPVAVDLGFFLAFNMSRLPCAPEAVLERYHVHLTRCLGGEAVRGDDWRLQRHAACLCGLLFYGWQHALEAAAGSPTTLTWWCDQAVAARDLIRW